MFVRVELIILFVFKICTILNTLKKNRYNSNKVERNKIIGLPSFYLSLS